MQKERSISEIRRDLVSGDWVVIATGRAKRPDDFAKSEKPVFSQPKDKCPFEEFIPSALAVYGEDHKPEKDWLVQVIPNKFPAFGRGVCAVMFKEGIYEWGEGVGFHEVIITRDHLKAIPDMKDQEVAQVLRAYQDRYLALHNSGCVEYISIFHNHGREAGASISHPHSQLIAIPVIPPDIARSLKGSAAYFKKEKKCVHCAILKHELKKKSRIIYENSSCVVLAPFASRSAFEMRVFPKNHEPQFELISEKERGEVANALRVSLAKLSRGLKNPDFNFFLHTAPTRNLKKYGHYHWHFEIVPKTAIWAGFEIGTGIEISTIAPESAAEFLRGFKI